GGGGSRWGARRAPLRERRDEAAQRHAQLCHPELDARLDGAQRLLEARRDLAVREAGEEGELDAAALLVGQRAERALQPALLLALLEVLDRHRLVRRVVLD